MMTLLFVLVVLLTVMQVLTSYRLTKAREDLMRQDLETLRLVERLAKAVIVRSVR